MFKMLRNVLLVLFWVSSFTVISHVYMNYHLSMDETFIYH